MAPFYSMALTWELVRASALLVVLWASAATWRWVREYRRFRRLELAIPGPRSLPVLGNALAFLGINHHNILSVLMRLWGERRDTISRASIFNRLIVFVSNADDFGKVVRDPRFIDKPWFFYGPLGELLGEGLATSPRDVWRTHRAVVNPAFNINILESYVDMFSEEAQTFVRALRADAEQGRDAYPFNGLHYATGRSVLRATMSIEMQGDDDSRTEFLVGAFRPTLEGIARRTYNVMLWPSLIFGLTQTARQQVAYGQYAEDFAYDILHRKRAILAKGLANGLANGLAKPKPKAGGGPPQRKAFVEHLVEAKLKGTAGASLSDQEIVDEVKTVYSAAVETTTTVSCFAMKMLSIRPEIQDRVYAELQDVFGDSDRLVSANDLKKLVYLECVVKETLRLFPALPLTARTVHEDTELDGKVIPAGAIVILNIIGLHRDPRHHKDPLCFDPDRFERSRAAGRHPFCFVPFSAGPRNCIGQRSGMLQVKTVLANVLRAYRIDAVDDGITEPSQFPLTSDLALRFVGGIRVRFAPRDRPRAG